MSTIIINIMISSILEMRRKRSEDLPKVTSSMNGCAGSQLQVCLTPQLLVGPNPAAYGWQSWQAVASHNDHHGDLFQSFATSPEETKPLSGTTMSQEHSLQAEWLSYSLC